jgi:hypothetical protein
MSLLSWARNLGDPGKVKGMFKSKSSFTTRQDSFFSWKSDELVVVMKRGNVRGAKGFTKFGSQTTNSTLTKDTEPEVWGNQ